MSELDFIDIRDLFKKLKGHIRSEVEEYVDKRTEELKDEAVMCIMNKVFNNMIDEKPLKKPSIIGKTKQEIDQEVIDTLFLGKTLIGKYKGRIYEVMVSNEGKFVYDGEKYNSPSTAGTRITGKSCNGWDFFKVCLDLKEGLKTLSYHRSKFLSNGQHPTL